MSEINRVVFDPAKTNVDHMEELLKESGTYIRTTPQRDNPQKDKDTRQNELVRLKEVKNENATDNNKLFCTRYSRNGCGKKYEPSLKP